MELVFLGTGTSQGVPVIGCDCPVCRSDDPRDRRMRTSAALRLDDGAVVLFDTTPELRLGALAAGLLRVDAVLYTHGHADHVMGLDDLRAFNQRNGSIIPCFGQAATIATLRRSFGYAEIHPGQVRHPDLPGITLHAIDGPFDLLGRTITPVPLLHGATVTTGYRIGSLAYCTDVSGIPESSLELLAGVETLVLGALRHRPHPAHLTVQDAVRLADQIGARRTWFTHMNHDLPHAATNAQLPPDRQLAHDGLVVPV